MFASPFARVYSSVTADISLFFLVFVSEWDKKVDDLWAFSSSERSVEASFLFFFFLFTPPSSNSLPSVSPSYPHCFPRLLGGSLGRQCARMDGWGDGGWMDRKHLSPITTEGNHIIWFAWRFFFFFFFFSWGRLICPSRGSIHLAMMSGHLSHSRQRVKRETPGGTDKQACWRCEMYACTLTCYFSSALQGHETIQLN